MIHMSAKLLSARLSCTSYEDGTENLLWDGRLYCGSWDLRRWSYLLSLRLECKV